jgi:hypothetical protein
LLNQNKEKEDKMLYTKSLISEEMADTRATDISVAMNSLHSAIAKLDNENKKIFWSKNLDQRMFDFARIEQLNVTCLTTL